MRVCEKTKIIFVMKDTGPDGWNNLFTAFSNILMHREKTHDSFSLEPVYGGKMCLVLPGDISKDSVQSAFTVLAELSYIEFEFAIGE